jgi:cephalosporin-C deacetylase-like acetyl esterase
LIRDLEDRVKRDFHDYLFVGHRNFRYEWITEEVAFDQIVQYLEWEIAKMDGIVPLVSAH